MSELALIGAVMRAALQPGAVMQLCSDAVMQ